MENYLDYVINELIKINTEYSNSILEKVRSIGQENYNTLNILVISANINSTTKIESYWRWCKKIKKV